jgi:hypothetical protein
VEIWLVEALMATCGELLCGPLDVVGLLFLQLKISNWSKFVNAHDASLAVSAVGKAGAARGEDGRTSFSALGLSWSILEPGQQEAVLETAMMRQAQP